LGPEASKSLVFDSQQAFPVGQDFMGDEGEVEGVAEPVVTSTITTSSSKASSLPPSSPKLDGHPPPPVSSSSSSSPSCPPLDFMSMAHQLRQAFHLDLFGFDVIICGATGQPLVVDVNYFPSFKEVAAFPTLLREFIRKKVHHSRKGGKVM